MYIYGVLIGGLLNSSKAHAPCWLNDYNLENQRHENEKGLLGSDCTALKKLTHLITMGQS